MHDNLFGVIMAGGVGSRFWPASTEETPKQFLDLTGEGKSLLRQTFERLAGFIPEERILVVTNRKYREKIARELPELPVGNILTEPAMRNTAPAVLYSANRIFTIDPDALMVVTPADHYIRNKEAFQADMRYAADFARKNDALMTIGIPPHSPHTGYGYIEFDPDSPDKIKPVLRFREKPDKQTAEQFIKQGNFLWNAGIFVWKVKTIRSAFAEFLPRMFDLLESDVYGTGDEQAFLDKNFPQAENISIDYGIMEKAGNVYVLPASFDWNDLGSWDALYRQLSGKARENVSVNTELFTRDAEGNLVFTEGKKVIIDGLKDYAVIEQNGVIMIIPLEKAQEVKNWRNKLSS